MWKRSISWNAYWKFFTHVRSAIWDVWLMILVNTLTRRYRYSSLPRAAARYWPMSKAILDIMEVWETVTLKKREKQCQEVRKINDVMLLVDCSSPHPHTQSPAQLNRTKKGCTKIRAIESRISTWIEMRYSLPTESFQWLILRGSAYLSMTNSIDTKTNFWYKTNVSESRLDYMLEE